MEKRLLTKKCKFQFKSEYWFSKTNGLEHFRKTQKKKKEKNTGRHPFDSCDSYKQEKEYKKGSISDPHRIFTKLQKHASNKCVN